MAKKKPIQTIIVSVEYSDKASGQCISFRDENGGLYSMYPITSNTFSVDPLIQILRILRELEIYSCTDNVNLIFSDEIAIQIDKLTPIN